MIKALQLVTGQRMVNTSYWTTKVSNLRPMLSKLEKENLCTSRKGKKKINRPLKGKGGQSRMAVRFFPKLTEILVVLLKYVGKRNKNKTIWFHVNSIWGNKKHFK